MPNDILLSLGHLAPFIAHKRVFSIVHTAYLIDQEALMYIPHPLSNYLVGLTSRGANHPCWTVVTTGFYDKTLYSSLRRSYVQSWR